MQGIILAARQEAINRGGCRARNPQGKLVRGYGLALTGEESDICHVGDCMRCGGRRQGLKISMAASISLSDLLLPLY